MASFIADKTMFFTSSWCYNILLVIACIPLSFNLLSLKILYTRSEKWFLREISNFLMVVVKHYLSSKANVLPCFIKVWLFGKNWLKKKLKICLRQVVLKFSIWKKVFQSFGRMSLDWSQILPELHLLAPATAAPAAKLPLLLVSEGWQLSRTSAADPC